MTDLTAESQTDRIVRLAVPTALRRDLARKHVSQALLSCRTGLSTKHINQICQGFAPITPTTALLLEEHLPTRTAYAWLLLQARDDLARLRLHQRSAGHEQARAGEVGDA